MDLMHGKLRVRFGALSPPLHEQLSEFGLSKEDLKWQQKLADAISLCNVHFVITDAETRKARQRLMKQLIRRVKENAG